MLLVDFNQRQISSLSRALLGEPLAPVTGLGTVDDTRCFLRRFGEMDSRLRRALSIEVTQVGSGAYVIHRMSEADLIAAAAREITARRIHVGSFLPDSPELLFDSKEPWSSSFENVVFPNLTAASKLVASLRANRHAIDAVDAALRQRAAPDSLRYDGGIKEPSLTLDNQGSAQRVAELLVTGTLLLRPRDLSRTTFQLAWRRPTAGSVRPAETAPRPTSATFRPSQPAPLQAAPAPQPAEPRSILPKAQSSNSPQAEALIAAAQSGVPFCEECARAAAGL